MRICNNSRLRLKLKQKNVQASRLVIVLIILFKAFDFFYLHINCIDDLFFMRMRVVVPYRIIHI